MKIKAIEVNELKKIQLEMLKLVDLFCKEHELRYSLAFGSLLGAVRHQGYIPWDDDLDIMLLRKDYEKLISSFKNEYYTIIDVNKSPDYQLPFAKIYDRRTIMEEQSRSKCTYGVYIDIFPIDNVPDDKIELNLFLKKKKFWNTLHILKLVSLKKERNLLKNIVLFCSHVLLAPISIHYIAKQMSFLSSKYENDNCLQKGIIVPDDNRKEEILPSVVFENYETLKFEGFDTMVISNYDTYLNASYGDYMKLPPKEKQVSHHVFKAYWK